MHVLALQLKRIGDAILTAPALEAVRAAAPGARVTLVLSGAASALAPAFTSASEVIRHRAGPGGLAAWLRLAADQFDVCLDFTGTDRSAAMARLSGAPARHGFARFATNPWRARAYTRLCDASVRDLHTVDFHRAMAADAFPPVPEPPTDSSGSSGLAPPPSSTTALSARLAAAGVTGPFALVHPGTARLEKYWLPDRWATVITALANDHHLHVVLTGSRDRAEHNHLGRIRSHLPEDLPVADLSGHLDLTELAAAAAAARVAVTVDSAAMHLAGVAGTPQVALFGPTNPFHWRPRHAAAAVLRGESPEPLSDFTPRAPGAPMSAVSTGAVIRAIGSVLSR